MKLDARKPDGTVMPGHGGAGQRPASAADQAYAYVREHVISGAFAAGTRLTEWQVADALGTSRTPVREALRRLVSDGLLRFKPNYGTFVGTSTAKEIGELFELRAVLESQVAGAAARSISGAQLQQLRQLQDQIEERGPDLGRDNIARISALNRHFHRVIAEASDSPRTVAMLTNAIEAPVVQQTFSRYTQLQLQRSFHHHRELIDAFHARDSTWARDAMSCHVRAAQFAILELPLVTALGDASVAPGMPASPDGTGSLAAGLEPPQPAVSGHQAMRLQVILPEPVDPAAGGAAPR